MPTAQDKTCRFCGQQFKKREHVVRHERSHSGERPFHCSMCGDSFARQDTLLRHTRIHANRGGADEDAVVRPGPTGSRRKRTGRSSGASTPRSRHQSPVLTPLTSLEGLQSPSQLSLGGPTAAAAAAAKLESSSPRSGSRAASPSMRRSPDPPAISTWHSDSNLHHTPLFPGSSFFAPQARVPSVQSPGLAYQHNSHMSAPSLLRKRTHTPSSESEDESASSRSHIDLISPRTSISRDASSTRLSEQVERWAPLGPSIGRSIVAPTSDTRSRPPSPTGMLRSVSSPQLQRGYPNMLLAHNLGSSEGESVSSADGESSSDNKPTHTSPTHDRLEGFTLRSPSDMALEDFYKPPKASPLQQTEAFS